MKIHCQTMHVKFQLLSYFVIVCLLCGSSATNNFPVTAQIQTQAAQTITFPRGYLPYFFTNIAMDSNERFGIAYSPQTSTAFTFDAKTGAKLADVAIPGPVGMSMQGDRAAFLSFDQADFITPPQIFFLDVSNPRNPTTVRTDLPENRIIFSQFIPLILSRDGRWLFTYAADFDLDKAFLIAIDSHTGEIASDLEVEGIGVIAVHERNGQRTLVLNDLSDRLVFIDATNPSFMRQRGAIPVPTKGTSFINIPLIVSDNDDIGFFDAPSSSPGNPSTSTLVSFDIKRAKILTQTPIPGSSRRSLVNVMARRNNRLIVAEAFSRAITTFELDPAGLQPPKQLSKFSLPDFFPNAAAISADGNTGFVSGQFPTQLISFDMRKGTVRGVFTFKDSDNRSLTEGFATNSIATEFMLQELVSQQVLLVKANADGSLQMRGKFAVPDGVCFNCDIAGSAFETRKPAVTQDGTRAYLASALSDEILEISPSTGALLNRIKTKSHFPLTIKLFESQEMRRLAVITRETEPFFDKFRLELFASLNSGPWQYKATIEPFPAANLIDIDSSEVFFSQDGKIGFISDVAKAVLAFNTDTGEIIGQTEINCFSSFTLGSFQNDAGKRLLSLVYFSEIGDQVLLSTIDASDPRNLNLLWTTDLTEDLLFLTDNGPTFN
ncbi:MAG: hypothetical protein AB1489_30130, partial [Acidobacteriota bacterium]